MRLSPGTRLGAYEVTAALGAGGMGEVYRARDTKLGRDVALKTLPDAFAASPDRLMRFEREARTLASLNHPSIAHVYGIEDSTAARALVMELVEGEDLSVRIRRGPIPLEDALPIARQIADALAAAHDHGIIHRDLKPGNVKVRPDGTVKVLDFGLAKALDPSGFRTGPGDPDRPDQEMAVALANSPTITSPAMTMRGVILGTAAYMAPEQAKGKGIDTRVDIWAFGCVLYEMLAGRRAFAGEDVTDTLTAVLRDPPDWSALPAATPPGIRTLLRRCLEKSPGKRAAHISLARLEIDEALAAPADPAPPALDRRAQRARWRERAAWMLAAAGALAAGWAWLRPAAPPEASAATGRFTIEIPWVNDSGNAGLIALSPDGTSIAVQTSNTAAATPIYVRRIDGVGFTPIPGSDRYRVGSWSADGGALLALSRGGQSPASRESEVARIDVASGHARPVARFPDGLVPFTAVEGAGGVVLVGIAGQPLHMVIAGGTPTPIGALDGAVRELEQQSPAFLPDGRRFFYTSVREGNQLAARLRSLDANEAQDLAGIDGRIIWADDRRVIFRREGSLFAQPLSYVPLALQGRAVLLADNAPTVSFLPRQPLAAATSTLLAYRTGTQVSQQFAWFGRDGRRLATLGPEGTFSTFDLARDGTRLVVSRNESVGMNLWVVDTATGTFNRVTTGSSTDLDPRVSPDGRAVIFASTRDSARSPFRSSLMGQEPSERVFPFSGQVYSNDDWSADGRWLLYHDASIPVLHARRLDRTDEPPMIVARALAGIIDQARMSGDGRWVAYNSTESGQSEVYVVPFPPTGDRWQVSAGGGVQPLWGQKDREMYYLSLEGTLMAVPLKGGAGLGLGRTGKLFQSPLRSVSGDTEQYAAAPDGSRFLFAPFTGPAKADVVTVVTNWQSMVPVRRE